MSKEVEVKGEDTVLNLVHYYAVDRHKSIRRAIRRGHVSPNGTLYPNRPFNNRKNRTVNENKKAIYNQIKTINGWMSK